MEVRGIITDAMKTLGVLARGETPAGEDVAHALAALNVILSMHAEGQAEEHRIFVEATTKRIPLEMNARIVSVEVELGGVGPVGVLRIPVAQAHAVPIDPTVGLPTVWAESMDPNGCRYLEIWPRFAGYIRLQTTLVPEVDLFSVIEGGIRVVDAVRLNLALHMAPLFYGQTPQRQLVESARELQPLLARVTISDPEPAGSYLKLLIESKRTYINQLAKLAA